MSTTRYDRDNLAITTFTGPAGEHHSVHSNTRTMVSIYSRFPLENDLSLTMDQWIDLVCFIRRMDKAGVGITSYSEAELPT